VPPTAPTDGPAPPLRAARIRNPEVTRWRVLAAAISEFARSGFEEARVDAIASFAKASKQLIYYYFGSKPKLSLSVLEEAYRDIREAENRLELDHLEPVAALRTLVTFTWNYYLTRPEFLALVTDENLHRARHIKRSRIIREMQPLRARLSRILEPGVPENKFRRGIDADQLNLTIAAIGYYYLNNRFTNSVICDTDLFAPEALEPRIQRRYNPSCRSATCCSANTRCSDPCYKRKLHTMSRTLDEFPVALVTGAARGIGRACALALSRVGFHIAANDLDDETTHAHLETLAAEIKTVAPQCKFLSLPADIAVVDNHPALLRLIIDRMGRLDCLVNNAGVGALRRGDILDVTTASFDRCIAVNTRSSFFLSQAVAKHMLTHQPTAFVHRSLIHITSSNAVSASVSRGEYCVSKSGASMTARLFAIRLAETGIGVYEIRPGIIDTDLTRPVRQQYDERIAAGLVPMRRWGTAEDVATVVVTMAEGRLPYTVGQAVAVDGGLVLPHY
jgi:NAD(P)-dependent dehydrogenase (short-subunit alcohol dehydrogenase family)/AcrR family transcriptional regulator